MEFSRESILISSLRAFFKTFAVLLGIGVALFVVVLGISSIPSGVKVSDKSEMTISADANWAQDLLPPSSPVILRINIKGVVGTGDLKAEKFKQMLVDSRKGILTKDRVKGILICLNTPGGTVTDSAAIHALLETYKKKYQVPIYAFVEGLCASGGMYISAAADKIYATADSTIGSVGVRFGPTFNVSEAMKKVGISSLTLTEGKNKDALNPFRPRKSGEEDAIRAVIAGDYEQFVRVVLKGRPRLSREKLIDEYGANLFVAETAQKYGFIDVAGACYDEALTALVKQAGIDDKTRYQVFQIQPRQSVLRDLTENNNALRQGRLKHVFPTGAFTDTEMSGQLLYLYQP